jgi:hypothetical protein
VIYKIRSIKELGVIIKFFQKYYLLTSKRHNFNLFVILYEILLKKEHLTINGFLKAVNIINNINKSLNPILLEEIKNKLGNLPPLVLPPVTII